MTNVTVTGNFSSLPSATGPRRPSSGRRSKPTRDLLTPPDTEELLPIYVLPFEQNNAWSTLVSVSPKSTVKEVRQVVQSKLEAEQKTTCEWWERKQSTGKRPSSGRRSNSRSSSSIVPKDDQPTMVIHNEETLPESVQLEHLKLKPYATLRLERPSSFSARRRRACPTLTNSSQEPSECQSASASSSAMVDTALPKETKSETSGANVKSIENEAPPYSRNKPGGEEDVVKEEKQEKQQPSAFSCQEEAEDEEERIPETLLPRMMTIESNEAREREDDADGDFDELAVGDIGDMPLHSRPTSPDGRDYCQHHDDRNQPPRCASVLSTQVPSSPSPYPGSPSPYPGMHDDSFQEVIKDLELQLSQEKALRQQMRDALTQEREQLAEEEQAARFMCELHEEDREQLRSYEVEYIELQQKCKLLESAEERQKALSKQATQDLQAECEKLRDKEKDWEIVKRELEQKCIQYQSKCRDLRDEQDARVWHLEDEMQSHIQEALRAQELKDENLEASKSELDEHLGQLQGHLSELDDHTRYLRTELSEAYASHAATTAVQRVVNSVCLNINCIEVSPDKEDLKRDCEEVFPLLHSRLAQQFPGMLPSKEECHELFPLQYSELAQEHQIAVSEEELKQECSELLPLLSKELKSRQDAKSLQDAQSSFSGASAKEAADADMLRNSAKRLEAEAQRTEIYFSEHEEQVKLLREAQQTQEAKAQEELKRLKAEGDQLRDEAKKSKDSERRIRLVLFWSTYVFGAILPATFGAGLWFYLQNT